MNKQIEALKMANDILDDELWFTNKYPDEAIPVCFIDALKACKEALEPPAPSACEECIGFNKQLADENDSLKSRIAELQRYAEAMINRPTNHAPSWQSLSDDELRVIQNNSWIIHDNGSKEFNTFVFARAIEQALKEKNHA